METMEINAIIEENERLLSAMATRPCLKVTKSQFMALIEQNGKGFATVHAVTKYEPGKNAIKTGRLNKVPANEFACWPIVKTYSINFPLGADYEKIVNKQRENENLSADFQAGKSTNGINGISRYFAKHETNGKFYLNVVLPPSMTWAYGSKRYFDVNGVELDNEKICALKANYLKDYDSGNNNQGVENKIIIIRPSIENLRYFVMGGIVYEIMQTDVG